MGSIVLSLARLLQGLVNNAQYPESYKLLRQARDRCQCVSQLSRPVHMWLQVPDFTRVQLAISHDLTCCVAVASYPGSPSFIQLEHNKKVTKKKKDS